MGFWDFQLARDTEQGEEDNHGTAPSSKPESARRSIGIAYEGGPEHSCTPEPRLEPYQDYIDNQAGELQITEITADAVNPLRTLRFAVMNL